MTIPVFPGWPNWPILPLSATTAANSKVFIPCSFPVFHDGGDKLQVQKRYNRQDAQALKEDHRAPGHLARLCQSLRQVQSDKEQCDAIQVPRIRGPGCQD